MTFINNNSFWCSERGSEGNMKDLGNIVFNILTESILTINLSIKK